MDDIRAAIADARSRLEDIQAAIRLLLPQAPRLQCLKVSEVAAKLKLSPKAVQGLINRGELRAASIIVGGRKIYRVQEKDLEAFLLREKKPSEFEGEKVIMIPVYDD